MKKQFSSIYNSIVNHVASGVNLQQFPLKATGNLHPVFSLRTMPVWKVQYNRHEEAKRSCKEGRGGVFQIYLLCRGGKYLSNLSKVASCANFSWARLHLQLKAGCLLNHWNANCSRSAVMHVAPYYICTQILIFITYIDYFVSQITSTSPLN